MKRRGGTLGLGLVPVIVLASSAVPSTVASQASAPPTSDLDAPDSVGWGDGRYEHMEALLEVTIFNIDVLTLDVRVGPTTAARLEALVAGHDEYSEELADSVARVMLEADEAWASQVFLRDVGLGRLTGGMRETVEKAAEAGWISEEYASSFAEALPVWFGFLEERGAEKGDAIYFRVRGDEVRTTYRTVDGRILFDQVGSDPQGRRASIPSFFAPDTRFRKRLVESLLERP